MTPAPRRAATLPPGGAGTSRTGDLASDVCTDAPGAPQRASRLCPHCRKKVCTCVEDTLAGQMRMVGLPPGRREYVFWPGRRWRFDFSWPDRKIAAECEGGTWTGGRHTRGAGYEKDCEKYNHAALAGWRVYRFTAAMVGDGRALQVMEIALKGGE